MARSDKKALRKRHDRSRAARRGDPTRDATRGDIEEYDPQAAERVRRPGHEDRRKLKDSAVRVDEEDFNPTLADDGPPPAGTVPGRVAAIHAGQCWVDTDAGPRLCRLRGGLKKFDSSVSNLIAVGDRVAVTPLPDDEGRIERIERRVSVLGRADSRGGGRKRVVVANVEQLVIVSSAIEPDFKPGLLDRYLIAAIKGELAPTIVVNKIDLTGEAGREAIREVLADFEALKVTTLLTSATTGEGLGTLAALLKDRSSVLAGQSGVGKSSLLNALQRHLDIRVAEVSRETGKGSHTTTHVQMLALSFGGYVVDTPGIRSFSIWDLAPEELAGYFPEFDALAPQCHFKPCSHTHETGCAVRAAVEAGTLSARRYDGYVRLTEDLSGAGGPVNR
jgi:ribosome biogenesis GTPase